MVLENHISAFEHSSFGNQNYRIVARVFPAVGDQQLGQLLDVEAMLWNHTAVSCSSHRWQHGGKARVAAEDFENQKSFMRTGRRSQIVCHLNGASDRSAETDTVVGSGHIVVHGLRDRDYLHALLVQANAVAQRVIAADRDEEI